MHHLNELSNLYQLAIFLRSPFIHQVRKIGIH